MDLPAVLFAPGQRGFQVEAGRLIVHADRMGAGGPSVGELADLPRLATQLDEIHSGDLAAQCAPGAGVALLDGEGAKAALSAYEYIKKNK